MASGMVGRCVLVKCIDSSNMPPVYGIVESMEGDMIKLTHVRRVHNAEETNTDVMTIPLSQLYSLEIMTDPRMFMPKEKTIIDLKDLHLHEDAIEKARSDDGDKTSTNQLLQEPGDEDEEDEDDEDYEISEPESEEPEEEWEEDDDETEEEEDLRSEAKSLREDSAQHSKMLFNYAVEAAVLEKERKKMMRAMKKQASMQVIDLDADEMQQDA